MPLSRHERAALLFTFHVTTVPDGASAPAFDRCLELLRERWLRNEARARLEEAEGEGGQRARLRRGANAVFLREIQIDTDQQRATLLVGVFNDELADPSLLDKQTLAAQPIHCGEQQAWGFSAHLVVSLRPRGAAPRRYAAVLEGVDGLGRGAVQGALNYWLRMEAKDQELVFHDPQSNANKRYHPKLGTAVQPSESLLQSIQQRELTGITLINTGLDPDLLDVPGVKVRQQKLFIRVERGPISRVASIIRNVARFGRSNNYDGMVLDLSATDDARAAHPTFLTEDLAEALDKTYARRALVTGFGRELNQYAEGINPEMQTKLTEILEQQNLWRNR